MISTYNQEVVRWNQRTLIYFLKVFLNASLSIPTIKTDQTVNKISQIGH